MTRRLLAGAVAAALVPALLAGCASEQEQYCDAVKEHQEELTEITAQDDGTALLDALDIYRELRDEAPSDITDEWQQVIRSVEALDAALAEAGVDPATYDPEQPPPGVSAEQQEQIARAASEVGSLETQRALQGVEQQARDVCKTPLTL